MSDFLKFGGFRGFHTSFVYGPKLPQVINALTVGSLSR